MYSVVSVQPETTRCPPDIGILLFESPARQSKKKRPPYGGLFAWQGHKDSNSGHAVLETGTLPAELYPCAQLPATSVIIP